MTMTRKPYSTDGILPPEKVPTLHIAIEANLEPYRYTVVLSVPVEDVLPGDLIDVDAEFQATNDTGSNVMCFSSLLLTDDPAAIVGEPIAPRNGTNITPDQHHYTTRRSQRLVAAKSHAKSYVNMIGWAARTHPSVTGSVILTVDANHGKMSVVKERGV